MTKRKYTPINVMLAQARHEAGISRFRAGVEVGVHTSTFQYWENGVHPPSAKYIPVLAAFCSCSEEVIARAIEVRRAMNYHIDVDEWLEMRSKVGPRKLFQINGLVPGKRFGRLTLVRYSHHQAKNAYWECLCDCGSAKVIHSGHFGNGHTQSCGCIRKELRRAKFPTSERYGRWTLIEEAESSKYKTRRWLCRCDCGTVRVVLLGSLRLGTSKSCGCAATEALVASRKRVKAQRLAAAATRQLGDIELRQPPDVVMSPDEFLAATLIFPQGGSHKDQTRP